MTLETLYSLYVEQLQDLHSAETQIVKALPKLVKAATTPELRATFESHLAETEEQVQRLDQILKELGESSKGKKCVAMQGILKEAQELFKEKADPDVLNAGLISAAQRVEHYEMAAYGSVRTYARQLGYTKATRLLQLTLDEEGDADDKLTQLALSWVNMQAPSGSGNGHEREHMASPMHG